MSHFKKTNRDKNHLEITKGLKDAGFTVIDLASVGSGVPDIICGVKSKSGTRFNLFMEIKTATGELRPNQIDFVHHWKGQTSVIRSLADALKICQSYADR